MASVALTRSEGPRPNADVYGTWGRRFGAGKKLGFIASVSNRDPVPVEPHHYEFYIFGGVDFTPAEIDSTGAIVVPMAAALRSTEVSLRDRRRILQMMTLCYRPEELSDPNSSMTPPNLDFSDFAYPSPKTQDPRSSSS
jgi:hypothetical protein